MLVALVGALVAAACSTPAPSPDDEEAAPTATPSPVDGQVEPTATAETLRDELDRRMAPYAAAPMACPEPIAEATTAEPIQIGFLNADFSTVASLNFAVDLGDEGAHFRALMDEVNETCGGINGRPVVVNSYSFDPIDPARQQEVCVEATQGDDNLIVVGRAFLGDNILCVTEANEVPYLAVLGVVDAFFDRSDRRLFSLQTNLDLGLETTARDLLATGQIDETTRLGVVWGDSLDQNVAVTRSLLPILDRAGIDVTEAVLPETSLVCSGYPTVVNRLREADVDTILATLNPVCYPGLVLEAANQGWFPRYLVPEYGNMNSDISTQRMADAGDAFDGTVGVTFSPTGNHRLPGVPAWDDACNQLVAQRVAIDWDGTTEQHGAVAQICTAAWVVHQGAHRAGADLDRVGLVAAMEQLDEIPLEGDLLGSFGPTKHWASELLAFTITWELECTCWRLGNGPRIVE